MTREEAIEVIKQDIPCEYDTDLIEALDMAIEALEQEYKNVAIDLLIAYLESEQTVIGEYSGDFKRSALELKKQVLMYLKRLDEGEDTFNELVKDMWIADYYKAESEDE